NRKNNELLLSIMDDEKALLDDAFDEAMSSGDKNGKKANDKAKGKPAQLNELFNLKHIDKQPFPFVNSRAIHLITLQPGDQQHFPVPNSIVHLMYTGYIYQSSHQDLVTATDREFCNLFFLKKKKKKSYVLYTILVHVYIDKIPSNWIRFTDPSTTLTASATPLGVGQNILGLEHAVMRMTVGQKCRVYVPSRLAYGLYGANDLIPPNADLVFDLHLIAIRDLQESAANPSANANSDLASNSNANDNHMHSTYNDMFITQEIQQQNKEPLENLFVPNSNRYYDDRDIPTEDL
ncbi:putative peptidyl-prolyl cis-trans isomerase, partial [Reticulomyxa filosa]